MKSEAVINGDIVRIGDLIDHAGIVATVPIFRAPDLGYTGTVSADTVLEAVRKHALTGVDTGDERDVVVTRASRTIPASAIEDAISRTLAARYDVGSSKDLVVSFARDVHAIYVEPSARGELRVTHIDYDPRGGRFDATIETPSIGGKQQSMVRKSPVARWRPSRWRPPREHLSAVPSSRMPTSSWTGRPRVDVGRETPLQSASRLWGSPHAAVACNLIVRSGLLT